MSGLCNIKCQEVVPPRFGHFDTSAWFGFDARQGIENPVQENRLRPLESSTASVQSTSSHFKLQDSYESVTGGAAVINGEEMSLPEDLEAARSTEGSVRGL